MKQQRPTDAASLSLIDCFARATWVALILALTCLIVDAYAMFWLPHHPISPGGTHGATFFAVSLWTLEIVLALLAFALVGFAFSRPSRFAPTP